MRKPTLLERDRQFAWLCEAWNDGIYNHSEFIFRCTELGYGDYATRAVADFEKLKAREQ
jgi:hypothetical protein